MSQLKQPDDIDVADTRWHLLYRVAGISALITAALILVQMIIFILWPPPITAIDYFKLFQDNSLLGFLALDLLYVVDNVLLVPILLALYVALRRTNVSFMIVAAALGFVGIAALFASNPAVSMHVLSARYAAAATEAQRSLYMAAGEPMLALYAGTAYHLSLILGSIALVVISVVMLRSRTFTKATAYMGILSNVLALGLYVPRIGIYILLFSIIFLWVWYILVTRSFFRLAQGLSQDVMQ